MLNKIGARHFRCCLLLLIAGLVGSSLVFGAIPAYAQTQKALIDLNTATQKELESVKGVGSATAKKIIAGRPYKAVEDLKKAGISDKTIESMKPYVKVGAAAPLPAKPATETKPAVQTKPVAETKPAVSAKPAAESKTAVQSKPAAQTKPAVETKPSVPAEKTKAPSKAAQAPAKLTPGQKVNLNTATKEQLEALPEIGPAKAQAIIDSRPYKNVEDVMKVKGIKEGTYNKIKDFITVR
ncbi:MAG: ComE operon protein 1 [Syntrophorhabdus sp. PtaU1.Bin153]|nr:MAG: ComE operon protein 1 [Syntrophorhabdus sp. PtaU1.Bin153]